MGKLVGRHAWKVAMVAVAAFAVVGYAAAQANGAPAQVFKLQLQRFEGNYRLSGGADGQLTVRELANGAELTISATANGKPVEIKATAAYDEGAKRTKSMIEFGGGHFEGTATLSGKELLIEAKGSGQTLRLRLRLAGRSDGDVSLSQAADGQPERSQLAASTKRSG